jgi:hypothetical protein
MFVCETIHPIEPIPCPAPGKCHESSEWLPKECVLKRVTVEMSASSSGAAAIVADPGFPDAAFFRGRDHVIARGFVLSVV